MTKNEDPPIAEICGVLILVLYTALMVTLQYKYVATVAMVCIALIVMFRSYTRSKYD